ncbi:MAG: hypothetical protein AB8V06_05845 [Francisella endosymbiont of Hyalomma asiaticum]
MTYGAVLMSVGHITLGFGGDSKLYFGIAFIVLVMVFSKIMYFVC